MELSCDTGDGVFKVTDSSESYYFNWLVPIHQDANAEAAAPACAGGSLLPPTSKTGLWSWGTKMQKPTLVLDLDLTLAYCRCLTRGRPQGGYRVWGIAKRPGLDEFLKALAPLYEIVVFTAADQSYADAVLHMIDPRRECVKHRLYGRHLSRPDLFKDISMLGRDLRRVVVIDDVPAVYGDHVGNVIQIAPYLGVGKDDKLDRLVSLLFALSQAKDVRIDIATLKQQGTLEQIAKSEVRGPFLT